MSKSKFTPFGLCVKTELLQRGMLQKELEEAVHKMTGLSIDNGYMYKILTGKRNPPNVIESICKILNLPMPSADELIAEKTALTQ